MCGCFHTSVLLVSSHLADSVSQIKKLDISTSSKQKKKKERKTLASLVRKQRLDILGESLREQLSSAMAPLPTVYAFSYSWAPH